MMSSMSALRDNSGALSNGNSKFRNLANNTQVGLYSAVSSDY